MRKIKSFQLFTEEVDFSPKVTDEPDIKMAKEKLATLNKQISEFNTLKPKIDYFYLNSATDADIEVKIKQLIGETDAKAGQDRNPFLVEYLHVANLKRKIDKNQKDITQDKLKKDDFSQELKFATEASTKEAVNAKLKEIDSRMSTKISDIATLNQQIAESEKKLKEKMTSIQKEMMDNIKKISSQSQK
jgi:hypothetical protein